MNAPTAVADALPRRRVAGILRAPGLVALLPARACLSLPEHFAAFH